jgi:hypothetical protein
MDFGMTGKKKAIYIYILILSLKMLFPFSKVYLKQDYSVWWVTKYGLHFGVFHDLPYYLHLIKFLSAILLSLLLKTAQT